MSFNGHLLLGAHLGEGLIAERIRNKHEKKTIEGKSDKENEPSLKIDLYISLHWHPSVPLNPYLVFHLLHTPP